MRNRKEFWLTICLFNLVIVALLGFALRSKILFSIPFLDYRKVLSAHSHFAFSGWAGLALLTLLIYQLLPLPVASKKVYTWILTAVQISSLGMVLVFPFYGYNAVSMFFSTLYIAATMVFAPVFIKDMLRASHPRLLNVLSIGAIISLILSYLGTLGLVYILSSKSGNSLLYKDSVYIFLHFQYNGFFTLGVFALFYDQLVKRGLQTGKNFNRFIILLCLSVIPSLFLSLLWHNSILFYIIASIGSALLLISLIFFFRWFRTLDTSQLKLSSLAKSFLIFSGISFVIKMILNAGTIIPSLGNAVYGDRPIIIGFLHLVFLGFLSFYLLASFVENQMFTFKNRVLKTSLLVFATGIFLNEIFLFSQGLFILFSFNSEIFKWLLWAAAIVLFVGAALMFAARLKVVRQKKSTTDVVL